MNLSKKCHVTQGIIQKSIKMCCEKESENPETIDREINTLKTRFTSTTPFN